ncbi:colicin E3/pyocin S6 family cytotoxin [Pseudomonas mohnii]
MDKDTPEKNPFDDIWRRKRPNGGASWAAWNPPPEPERVYIAKDEWPLPKERTDLVFAKSCVSENWCSTQAGTSTVPASDFGKVMLAGAMLVPSAAEAASLALGFDAVLGRVAGGGIMQQGFTWAMRGVTGPAGVFVLGMLPSKMADGTLYTDRQLRSMTHAPTRVRFQFRRDVEGVLQVYGIHTGPSGDDAVRTVQAKWNAAGTAIEAELNSATILWTPRERSGIPAMVHPDSSNSQGTILVHPIPEGTDSQIEGYPSGDDIETDDCILVFPADSGLSSLYLVFSRPLGGDHRYHQPPISLPAFPDAQLAPSKTYVQGGGKKRRRWKDSAGKIYEWDSQHGTVELYSKQGKHLGEYDPETGRQTKPENPARKVEK